MPKQGCATFDQQQLYLDKKIKKPGTWPPRCEIGLKPHRCTTERFSQRWLKNSVPHWGQTV